MSSFGLQSIRIPQYAIAGRLSSSVSQSNLISYRALVYKATKFTPRPTQPIVTCRRDMSDSPTAPMEASKKGLYLYTASTPNGHAVSVILEEMKDVYPNIDYDWEGIEIWKTRHKEPWFLAMNPNGRIPVLVDKGKENFNVFETSAILLYLTDHYDKNRIFSFDPATDPKNYSEMVQWLFFAHGGVGPMQGQAHHFHKYAPENIPYAKDRYLKETKRLYGVLELRLKDRDYLAGPGKGKYTIADAKTFPWLRFRATAGIDNLDEWPGVKAWFERCMQREASKRGIEVGAIKS